MAEVLNIYQRLAKATADIETVAKNLNVSTGKGGTYKAVSERDVIDAVKKVEAKHGIYSYPVARKIIESEQLESETQYGKKTTFYLRIETTYRFVNIDKPEEYIEVTGYGDGMDPGDKATGKAVTYSDKYCLLKAYKISTGDDPDKDPSEDTSYKRKNTAYKGSTDFTTPAPDTDELLRQVQEFCLNSGISDLWLASRFGKSSLSEMTWKELNYTLTKKATIIEAYEKGDSK